MLYACAQRFDVTKNLKKFCKILRRHLAWLASGGNFQGTAWQFIGGWQSIHHRKTLESPLTEHMLDALACARTHWLHPCVTSKQVNNPSSRLKSLGVSTRQNVNKCSSEKGRTKQMLHWQRPTLSLLPAYHPCHFIILACMPYCHGPAHAEQRAQWWYPCVRSDLKGPLLEISLTEPWVTNPKF